MATRSWLRTGSRRPHAAILLAGGDHQRGAAAVGVVEGSQAVTEAWCDVQVGHPDLTTHLGVGVGHGDGDGFVEAQDVLRFGGGRSGRRSEGVRWCRGCRRCG